MPNEYVLMWLFWIFFFFFNYCRLESSSHILDASPKTCFSNHELTELIKKNNNKTQANKQVGTVLCPNVNVGSHNSNSACK